MSAAPDFRLGTDRLGGLRSSEVVAPLCPDLTCPFPSCFRQLPLFTPFLQQREQIHTFWLYIRIHHRPSTATATWWCVWPFLRLLSSPRFESFLILGAKAPAGRLDGEIPTHVWSAGPVLIQILLLLYPSDSISAPAGRRADLSQTVRQSSGENPS